jgi:uncharacterized membrane protein
MVVAVGGAILWPGSTTVEGQQAAADAERAEVVGARAIACRAPEAHDCRRLQLELLAGPEKGQRTFIRTGDALSDPKVDVGDELRVVKNAIPEGASPEGIDPYTITDFERRMPLVWLAVIFVVVVLLVGRSRGARALVGLAGSLAVVFGFIVPAILEGEPPAAVALIGALAIMLVTVVVTHGVGPKSVAAILGTTISLAVTVALGALFVELAHLTGLSSDASTLLLAGREDLSLEGIILAGLVIGALGVLDDVTVSQASTVLALRRANARLSARELYRRGLAVGQDHASATVNTLVLAYVGAALPALLIFNGSGARFGDSVNSEQVAEEIVAMLAGSVGLMTAVPLTTAFAAWLAVRLRAEQLSDVHAHVH